MGRIDDELVTKLTPEILNLLHLSRDPISVYIDSPGGLVSSMEAILKLLRLTNQDSVPPCQIITAATISAASAAADLLSYGDYAIAFPASSILYHGLRTYEKNPLTLEYTSTLANNLRLVNDVYAMQLARKIEDRFTFRYVTATGDFDEIRTSRNKPSMSNLECFIDIIGSKLSKDAKKVWDKAADRHGRYEDLLNIVISKVRLGRGPQTRAHLEGDQIKALVALELKSNKNDPTWTFSGGGISRLVDDFFLLTEYMVNYGSERVKNWCTTFGKWTLPPAKRTEIEEIADEEARTNALVEEVRPILQPIWSFFVALCHALQEGENRLSATDAYWLGLVDEVIGQNLMSFRYWEELDTESAAKDAPNEETQPTD